MHTRDVSGAAQAPTPPAAKLKGGALALNVLGRAANPAHLWRALRLQMTRKAHRHTYDDAQLALYSQILPGEFLHFGYFDEPTPAPEDISLAQVVRAQERYADLLLELVDDRARPVLDVGCGMGGLSRMLRDRGFRPVALTPDRLQAAHVRATLPDVPLVRSKLERFDPATFPEGFGTAITAESLQYLKLDQALPVLEAALRPGGRWVVCDFFHTRPTSERSGHQWATFVEKVEARGWRITHERDVTANVLPTLAYAHMWAVRFGVPMMHFGFLRLRRKQPGLHHLLAGAFERIEREVDRNLRTIDPAEFAAGKRYALLTLEHARA